jgi:hypothetical protein
LYYGSGLGLAFNAVFFAPNVEVDGRTKPSYPTIVGDPAIQLRHKNGGRKIEIFPPDVPSAKRAIGKRAIARV